MGFFLQRLHNGDCQDIMLRFTPAEGRYALHHYPCVLLPDNAEIQLVLTVLSTHNLRLELLSYGPAREC